MFELTIKCSKDIDELHINFNDGSSSIISKPDKPITKENNKQNGKDIPLDLDNNYETNFAIIEKPIIEDKNRPVSVADGLQNAEF